MLAQLGFWKIVIEYLPGILMLVGIISMITMIIRWKIIDFFEMKVTNRFTDITNRFTDITNRFNDLENKINDLQNNAQNQSLVLNSKIGIVSGALYKNAEIGRDTNMEKQYILESLKSNPNRADIEKFIELFYQY